MLLSWTASRSSKDAIFTARCLKVNNFMIRVFIIEIAFVFLILFSDGHIVGARNLDELFGIHGSW
jgi:hypothetical protein